VNICTAGNPLPRLFAFDEEGLLMYNVENNGRSQLH